MKVYFAADHAGFELKEVLRDYVKDELGYEVVDLGNTVLDTADDYPSFVVQAARVVAEQPQEVRAIILGGSGQGEAMVANRFNGVRAAVYYGEAGTQTDIQGDQLTILASVRTHNDSNVLALGARFLTRDQAKAAVRVWLETPFSGDERHTRRIQQLDTYHA